MRGQDIIAGTKKLEPLLVQLSDAKTAGLLTATLLAKTDLMLRLLEAARGSISNRVAAAYIVKGKKKECGDA